MGNRLSKIYTRTGDDGSTGLGDGSRTGKDAARVEAYGTVDEANSCIGLVLASDLPGDVRGLLTAIQHQLFDLGGELCIPGHAAIDDADVERLEQQLDHYNADLPPLKEFILPGGGEAAARCHVARTVVRRAERRAVALARVEDVRPQAVRYLNRLSDLLFVLCRVLARASGEGQVTWPHDRRTPWAVPARRLPAFTLAACFGHDTRPGHVESPARLGAVVTALRDHVPDLDWLEAPRATRGQLLRVHEPLLLHQVLEGVAEGIVPLDPDTVLSPGSPEAALRAAGAGVAAVDLVMGGGADAAFCAVRPPGHHATAAHAMGFCLFNNIAVAAAHALDRHGLSRVAVVDFDVHHGNGTQAIFQDDPRVLYA